MSRFSHYCIVRNLKPEPNFQGLCPHNVTALVRGLTYLYSCRIFVHVVHLCASVDGVYTSGASGNKLQQGVSNFLVPSKIEARPPTKARLEVSIRKNELRTRKRKPNKQATFHVNVTYMIVHIGQMICMIYSNYSS